MICGPQREAELAQRLGIGHLGRADARELPVHQVGPDFALERRIAPVAHVLEHQQPNHDIDRCALAPARAAVLPAAGDDVDAGALHVLHREARRVVLRLLEVCSATCHSS